jgi:lipid-binding SYLF domain-containing protein
MAAEGEHMVKHNHLLITVIALAFVVSFWGTAALQAKGATEERERAVKAGDVLSEIMQIPEGGIPDELMEHAEAVAVIPHVVKGAFIVGGEFGKGLVSERLANGRWSAPSFIKIAGGNFGLQLGAEATDLVLVFTDRDGFRGLLKGKVKLGADAQVAAGPVGRHAQAATDVLLKSPVLAYSRSKGLFAGISLDGSVVSIDDSANRKAYTKEVTAEDILINGKVAVNDNVAPFVRVLERYAPPKKRVTD